MVSWRVPSILTVGLLALGCGRGLILRQIEQNEKIVRTYSEPDDPDATIVISRWDTIVRKWRVTSNTAAVLYQVDTRTQICRSGSQIVPCENIKRDPDMALYIAW